MPTIGSPMPSSAAPPRPGTRRRRPLVRRFLATCAAAVAVTAATVVVAPPASAANPIYFGVGRRRLRPSPQRPANRWPTHAYSHFSGSVPERPDAHRPRRRRAGARSPRRGPGSALYNDIVRWAQTIKAPWPVTSWWPTTTSPRPAAAAATAPPRSSSPPTGGSSPSSRPGRHERRVDLADDRLGVPRQPERRPVRREVVPGRRLRRQRRRRRLQLVTCGQRQRQVDGAAPRLATPVLAFARARGKKASLPGVREPTPTRRRAQWLRERAPVPRRRTRTSSPRRSTSTGRRRWPANGDCRWTLSTSAE